MIRRVFIAPSSWYDLFHDNSKRLLKRQRHTNFQISERATFPDSAGEASAEAKMAAMPELL